VRRHLFDLVFLFAVFSIAAAYVALAQPGVRNVTLHAYVLLVGGLIMLGVVAGAGDAVPRRHRSEFERALGEAARGDEPVHEVERMEREVSLGTTTAYDLHTRLIPQLRQIAQARLERSGRAMGPDALGPWWELLRPDRPAPEDRHGPGISASDLRALVSDLERM
jgi:uncharacterized membrane protein